MTPNPKSANKIIWFLIGNPVFTASSRIHGLAVHRELLRLGYHSLIAYLPEFIEDEIPFDFSKRNEFEAVVQPGDLIILQKIKNGINLPLLHYFKRLGLRLFLIDCDLPVAAEIGKVVDQVICTSRSLRHKYLKNGIDASFIEDSPELYFEAPKKVKKDRLQCFWFGDSTPQKWKEVVWLEQLLKDERLSKWSLVTISNHLEASIQWSTDFLESLKSADVIALPIETESEESSVKSANRLLQSMALSVPVICSPLLSYTDIVHSGSDAIICSTDEEWIAAFKKLEDEKTREQMSKAAFATSVNFSIDKAIHLWINLLALSESFKTDDLKALNRIQLQLNDFFYRPLVMKNPFYWKKMQFSVTNFGWLCYSVALKLKKKLSI